MIERPKKVYAKCVHYTPGGRTAKRQASFDPLLPGEFQGLCKSCLGEAMIKHANKAQAERLANKVVSDVLTVFPNANWLRPCVYESAHRRLLEMGIFASARRKRAGVIGAL